MTTQRIHDYFITSTDETELKNVIKEVFTRHTYYVELENLRPTIIDAGAHVGVTTIYFKHLYPGAKIIAIEPNPNLAALLRENVTTNRLENVEICEVALAATRGTTTLYIDPQHEWLTTGSVIPGAWTTKEPTIPLTVPARSLADFLTEPVDILKLDIEGAEENVLIACREELRNCQTIIMEYHPTRGNDLTTIATHLKRYGFTSSSPEQTEKKERFPSRLQILEWHQTTR